jgi:hypothetical protein
MRDPETVVREFCAAWSGRDVDTILVWCAADAVYHNMAIAPCSEDLELDLRRQRDEYLEHAADLGVKFIDLSRSRAYFRRALLRTGKLAEEAIRGVPAQDQCRAGAGSEFGRCHGEPPVPT